MFVEQTNEERLEQDYRNVVYLNNSITNENYFCLAYNNTKDEKVGNAVALILYSENVELIDDVIREYAFSVSSELNQTEPLKSKKETGQEKPKQQQHACTQCPMQQFVELCEYLENEEKNKTTSDILYDYLVEGLNKSLDLNDQNFLNEVLNEKNLTLSIEPFYNLQIMVALVHKLCRQKQRMHLTYNFEQKNNLNIETEKKFELIKDGKLAAKEIESHLQAKSPKKKTLQRSNTIYSVESKAILEVLNSKLTSESDVIDSSKLSIPRIPSFLKSFNRIQNYQVLMVPKKDTLRRSLYSKIMGPSSSTTCPNLSEAALLNSEYHIVNVDKNAKSGFFLTGGRFKDKSDVRQFWKKVGFFP